MVAVFREVRRVLRDDGTLWLNLGDSYASSGKSTPQDISDRYDDYRNGKRHTRWEASNRAPTPSNLKSKDLCGIPWRVAFALQADGWYLRQDIIWSKPNPMPESVTDRCTKAHEYLFLLSKRPTYYYDAEAIKEPASENTHPGYSSNGVKTQLNDAEFGVKPSRFDGYRPSERNKRSVWEVTTAPFSEAHFATFPPALIEPCIKAGTSEKGCCGQCGKPWARQVEYGDLIPTRRQHDKRPYGVVVDNPDPRDLGRARARARNGHRANMAYETTTTGWLPSCACAAEVQPCTVFDPFAGAGTTGLVADRLQRNAILIELNPAYAGMSQRRIVDDAPLFAEVRA
jgi:DNA modification methylase